MITLEVHTPINMDRVRDALSVLDSNASVTTTDIGVFVVTGLESNIMVSHFSHFLHFMSRGETKIIRK